MKKLIPLLAASAITLIGCVKLQPGGAYNPVTTNIVAGVETVTAHPDPKFFDAELAFDLTASILETVHTFEHNHRAELWALSPDIKRTLDKVWPVATAAEMAYAKASQAYIDNPTPGGLTGVQSALAEIQHAWTSVKAALPESVLKTIGVKI
jgi:hypothetical protein